jgi:hypothetical protein
LRGRVLPRDRRTCRRAGPPAGPAIGRRFAGSVSSCRVVCRQGIARNQGQRMVSSLAVDGGAPAALHRPGYARPGPQRLGLIRCRRQRVQIVGRRPRKCRESWASLPASAFIQTLSMSRLLTRLLFEICVPLPGLLHRGPRPRLTFAESAVAKCAPWVEGGGGCSALVRRDVGRAARCCACEDAA